MNKNLFFGLSIVLFLVLSINVSAYFENYTYSYHVDALSDSQTVINGYAIKPLISVVITNLTKYSGTSATNYIIAYDSNKSILYNGTSGNGLNIFLNPNIIYVIGMYSNGASYTARYYSGMGCMPTNNSIMTFTGQMWGGAGPLWGAVTYGDGAICEVLYNFTIMTNTSVTPTINFSIISPINTTNGFMPSVSNLTPNFSFSAITDGSWNVSLIINNSKYGSNVSYVSGSNTSIIANASLTAGYYYTWWLNATSDSYTNISEKRDLFIRPSTLSTSCIISGSNFYIVPPNCKVS